MTIVEEEEEEGGDGKGERGELGVALLSLMLTTGAVDIVVDGGVVEVVADVVLNGDGVAMLSLPLLVVVLMVASGVAGASVSKFDAETIAVAMATSAMAGVIAADKVVGVSGEEERVEADRTEEGEDGDEDEGEAIWTILVLSLGYVSVSPAGLLPFSDSSEV